MNGCMQAQNMQASCVLLPMPAPAAHLAVVLHPLGQLPSGCVRVRRARLAWAEGPAGPCLLQTGIALLLG